MTPASRLGHQAWLDGDGGRTIAAALDVATGRTRLVGGAVRDGLLGLAVSDIDMATQFAPAETVARLRRAGIGAVPTGIAHGTVTAVAPGLHIEVTTLRRDVASDGRHAEVAFTDDWRADAARRDFTINALYANPVSGEINDFFGGLDDLVEYRVRFIGVPLDRIAEDHLRILRFFRFHARFGRGAADAAGLAACAARAADLTRLSRERVRDELLKLLVVADPVPTLAAMAGAGVIATILPEADAARLPALARLCRAESTAAVAPDAVRRLAALLPVDAGVLDAVATRLRLSNAQRCRLVLTADRGGGLAATAYRDGADSAVDRALLGGEVDDVAGFRDGWVKPARPVSGGQLIARGVAAGPEVGRILAAFDAAWIAAGFPADPAAVERLLAPLLPAR